MAGTLFVAAPLFGAYANAAANPSAYLTNGADNTVSVIATASNTVVATIPVGQTPLGLAVTPDQAHAYVTDAGDSTVSVIATASNTVVATVPVGANPHDVAITPDGTRAYVTNVGDSTISVIAIANNTVVATIPVKAPDRLGHHRGWDPRLR
jgi:YVTN family beta-propeller protein